MMAAKEILRFQAFSSSIDTGFWPIMSKKKLEEFQLNEEPALIHGSYKCNNREGVPSILQLDHNCFQPMPDAASGREYSVAGDLIILNTRERFVEIDKKELLQKHAQPVWRSLFEESTLKDPQVLTRFLLLSFADLKKYHYYYWFAFPAFADSLPIVQTSQSYITHKFSQQQLDDLTTQMDSLRSKGISLQYFVIHESDSKLTVYTLDNESIKLSSIKNLIFVFSDPSTTDHPGWPLRNYLSLISAQFIKDEDTTVSVIGWRDRIVKQVREVSHSVLLTVKLSPLNRDMAGVTVVGWEKNFINKKLPRSVDMSKYMDPVKMAQSAVDLNLKLMKWRLLPELDLDVIAGTKCLLIGAGTLGCNVARNLIGWGVRHVTFLDNANVSFSNPVRQSLFNFKDARKPKAETAAENIKLIHPNVVSEGHNLTIPMPGHPVSEGEIKSVLSTIEKLEKLISSHDAIYLLMDSRESRWLPTLIGASYGKLVLTAALGFDTWLAMRHGFPSEANGDHNAASNLTDKSIPGSQLGCYFCNDIVAPRNSQKDRTLDQQCTVSRPGLSMICSALIVELMTTVLQHPLKIGAPSILCTSEDDEGEMSILGVVPHQIRGFLSRYSIVTPVSRKFDCCTACSDVVVKTYREDGSEFLLKCFNEPLYLEQLTGLDKLQNDPLADMVMSDFDGEEDDW